MFLDIFPEQLEIWRDEKKAQMIDVREPFEFATAFIAESKNIPLSQILKRSGEISRDRPVLLICATGNRSGQIAHYLAENLGYTEVANLVGGVYGWQQQGRQVVNMPC